MTELVFEDPPVRPVRLDETRILADQATGEIIGWDGLNDDHERCPADLCGHCPRSCLCAPCHCSECEARTKFANRPVPDRRPASRGPQLVLV